MIEDMLLRNNCGTRAFEGQSYGTGLAPGLAVTVGVGYF